MTGCRLIALAGDDAPGVPAGVLAGFNAPALNDNDELAFVASVRRATRHAGRPVLLERAAAAAAGGGRRAAAAHRRHDGQDRRAGAEQQRRRRVSGRDPQGPDARRHLRCRCTQSAAAGRAGDRAPDGAMILRFSERVAIDDDGRRSRSAPISAATAAPARRCCGPVRRDSAVIAVEGADAPGGGRYAGFGPWPTVAPGGVTAFIAALDGGPGPLAAFAGDRGRLCVASPPWARHCRRVGASVVSRSTRSRRRVPAAR